MFENIQDMKNEVFYQSTQIDIKFSILYTVFDVIATFRRIINYCIFIILIICICMGVVPIWQSIGGFIALIVIGWMIHKYIIDKIDSDYKGVKCAAVTTILDNYNRANNLEEWEYNKTLESLLAVAGLEIMNTNNN